MARLSWRAAPEAMTDASGDVRFDIWAVDDEGEQIPGYSKTMRIDAAEIQAALAKPTQYQQVTAMKDLIAARLKATLWSEAALEAAIAENARAEQAVGDFDTWRAEVLEMEYPLNFTL